MADHVILVRNAIAAMHVARHALCPRPQLLRFISEPQAALQRPLQRATNASAFVRSAICLHIRELLLNQLAASGWRIACGQRIAARCQQSSAVPSRPSNAIACLVKQPRSEVRAWAAGISAPDIIQNDFTGDERERNLSGALEILRANAHRKP
jgi:hypothetical protein